MPRRSKASGSQKFSAKAGAAAPDDHVIERPDGFYWESKGDAGMHGPFPTLAEAQADMLAGGAAAEGEIEEGESLHEAESELGMNDWIDPDTGGPAEDHVPHIEDH
jgi:hypothetical protein